MVSDEARDDCSYTAATRTIRRRRRWPFRSIRLSPTPSTAQTTARRSSTSRSRDTATLGSATRPQPCSNGASPRSKAAWRRSAWPRGRRRCNYAVANLAEPGHATSFRCRSCTARRTRSSRTCCPSQGVTVHFAASDQAADMETLIDQKTARDFLREHRQSSGKHLRRRSAGARRARSRNTARRRQHGRDADSASPDRLRRGYRGPLADEVHGRPRHDARRRRSSTAAGFPGRSGRSGFRCSTSRIRRTTIWSMTDHFEEAAYHRPLPQRLPADDRVRCCRR